MILRPYQEKGIADIRALFMQGKRRVCYAAPTGSGKTVLFCHAAKRRSSTANVPWFTCTGRSWSSKPAKR